MKKIIPFLFILLSTVACRSDIRPDSLSEKIQPSRLEEAKGRTLLSESARVHGAERFRQIKTYDMQINDHWVGLLGSIGNPWPESSVDGTLSFRANSSDGRMTFSNPDFKGLVWGIQSMKPYTVQPKAAPEFEENADIHFILPALQYLTEFIFRNHDEHIVSYAGPEEINGKLYERVFVTWNSLEPSDELDQYMAYIDPKTFRLEKLRYTIREFAGFAEGTIHYEDLHEIDGILFSFKQSITSGHTDAPDDFIHRVLVGHVAVDQTPEDAFYVDRK